MLLLYGKTGDTVNNRLCCLVGLSLLLSAPLLSCSHSAFETGHKPAEEYAAVAASGLAATTPVHYIADQQAPVRPKPDTGELMQTIDALCQTPRPAGSREEAVAAEYLQTRLGEYGYWAEQEPFAYNITRSSLMDRYRQVRELTGDAFFKAALPGNYKDGDSQNIIGRQREEDAKEKILVLSAHYDSVPNSIGVVDNASGVAVVLEAARILAEEDLPFSLRIVFFGVEEEILIGSRQHLLNRKPAELRRIVGNITVDTVAYSAEEGYTALTALKLEQEDAATLAQASPVAAAFLADARVSPAFGSRLVGDYMAFSAAGIDSINFGQSMDAVSDVINSPKDTYDFLVPERLPDATQLLVDAVLALAAQS